MSGSRGDIMAKLRRTRRGDAVDIAADLEAIGHAPVPALPHSDLCTAFAMNVLANHGTIAGTRTRSETVTAVRHYLYDKLRSQKLVSQGSLSRQATPQSLPPRTRRGGRSRGWGGEWSCGWRWTRCGPARQQRSSSAPGI